ncbi:NAD-dependent epimerase/dehydratase family protein [Filibacter tadaridae]|uniref:UDP-glucose 4-epimerase n=1 Tax=Filibacter tadaridae TaxID=2483811 RepID=A0A3P5X0J3_9BACL|nr:NAD-dependent epimerase/dehydratase family protein [Filibacter tadaridae]VDC28904.1 UDP-glucose 4-epimerase [Filibacter tadaridae]
MKVVVTGGAGFIGSHLVDALIANDAEVHVLDNLVSGKIENVNAKAIIQLVDICSKEAKQLIVRFKPDFVVHLAAQADVGKSVHDPKYDAEVNIKGTINVLEASREAGVKKVIFASTSAVYGNLNKELITEDAQVNPASYYGLSKLTAEQYIQLFHELYRLPFTVLRFANVYGPRQLPKGEGGVVSVFLERIKMNGSLRVHGDGEQTRDFIYVTDVVNAIRAAMEHGHQQTIQISTAKRTSINEILNHLSDIHGFSVDTISAADRPGDIKHSCLCNKKAKSMLKWSPKVSILEGLTETYLYNQVQLDVDWGMQ